MNSYYETLGLTNEATPAEIKRAYFKLIRQHSPESDPEGFQKIREAYEMLKDGGNEEEDCLRFELPAKGIEKRFADQIEDCMRNKNMRLARDTAEEAWKYFPGQLYFLHRLTVTQRFCGNTGKAVKNAELLVSKEPDNKWFWRELAVCRMERGHIHKAVPAFEKAYGLGIRDPEFILTYSLECDNHGEAERAMELLLELVRRDLKWKESQLPDIEEAFEGLYALLHRGVGETYSNEILERLITFIEDNKRYFLDNLEILTPLLLSTVTGEVSAEALKHLKRTVKQLAVLSDEKEKKQIFQEIITMLDVIRMSQDKKLVKSLQYMAEASMNPYDNPDLERFLSLDTRLCAIEERKDIISQMDYLKEVYPDFYGSAVEFLELLRDENKVQRLKESLQKQYRAYEFPEEIGNYYLWFPEEKKRMTGMVIWDGEAGTFFRQNKKIGRNDPCPCGSGKKYKHCCMNKA